MAKKRTSAKRRPKAKKTTRKRPAAKRQPKRTTRPAKKKPLKKRPKKPKVEIVEVKEKRKLPKTLITICIAALLILVISLYYVDCLKDLTLSNVRLKDFSVAEDSTFHLSGDLILDNKANIPVRFNRIEYDVYLGDEDTRLASGIIKGRYVPASVEFSLPFEQKIYTEVEFEKLVEYLGSGSHALIVEGRVFVFKTDRSAFSFEKRFPAKDTIKAYVEARVDTLVGDILESERFQYPSLLNTLQDNLKKQLDQI